MIHLFLIGLFIVLPAVAAVGPVKAPDVNLIRKIEIPRLDRWRSLDADSSHSYDMIGLELDYRVEESPDAATGRASLTFVAEQALNVIPFNAEGLQISAVTEVANPLTFYQQNDTVYVERVLEVSDTVTFDFQVSVPVNPNNSDVGFHVAWRHAFTFAEPYGARRWYPCFDQPYDKFNYVRLAVNMPEHWSLAANGALIETAYPAPGRRREVYEHNNPISSYLVMICAGEYTKRYETVDGVEFRYFAFPEDSMKAVHDWERTPQMVALFNDRFGEYPFGQYGMVQAAIFIGWGGMYLQTLSTYGFHLEDSLRTHEPIVAHELAHQWFGDALGPVDFRNMWLNEGFATYGDALWVGAASGEQGYRDRMALFAQAYFQEDSLQLRYTMYDPPPEYIFGAVIYMKGAWVLQMLREQLLGDSLFYAAMRTYVDAHLYGTVDTEDFISAINSVANQDLHWFFDQWVYQAGHPVLDIVVTHGSPEPNDVSVTVIQQQTNAPIFRLPISVDVTTVEGTTTRLFWVDQQTQTVIQTFGSAVSEAAMSAYQPLLYRGTTVGVSDKPSYVAAEFSLAPAYPNPFNATTTIPFELSKPATISLALYDLTGRLVRELVQARYDAGHHEFAFDAGNELATGLYLVALESNHARKIQKLVLLK